MTNIVAVFLKTESGDNYLFLEKDIETCKQMVDKIHDCMDTELGHVYDWEIEIIGNMDKMKALFKKLKPETPVSIAITYTTLSVLAFIAGVVILVVDPAVFMLLVMFGILVFIIVQVYNHFLKYAQKSRRR